MSRRQLRRRYGRASKRLSDREVKRILTAPWLYSSDARSTLILRAARQRGFEVPHGQIPNVERASRYLEKELWGW